MVLGSSSVNPLGFTVGTSYSEVPSAWRFAQNCGFKKKNEWKTYFLNGSARKVAELTRGRVAGLHNPNAFLIYLQNLLGKGIWVALRERPVHI